MKKSLFLFLMLSAAIVASAQNLTGTWKAVEKDDDIEATTVYVFQSDGQASMKADVKMDMDVEDGVVLVMSIHIAGPATWSSQGGKVAVVFDKKANLTATTDVDVKGVSESQAAQIKSKMKLVTGLLTKMMKKEILSEFRGQTINYFIRTEDGRTVLVEDTKDDPMTLRR